MIWGNQASVARVAPPHTHRDHELVIALNDGGDQVVREARYPARIGQAWFLPSGVPHQVEASPEGPMDILFVCFPPGWFREHGQPAVEEIVRDWQEADRFAPELAGSVRRQLVDLATQLNLELRRQDAVSREMAHTLLVHMLLLIHRQGQQPTVARQSPEQERLTALCDDILAHPEQDVGLDDSARRCGMSRSSFTEAFRELTGKSLIAYVLEVRIADVCRRLAVTDDAVADVAAACGFHNLGHFHSVFKREVGQTPLQYRRKVDEQGGYHAVAW